MAAVACQIFLTPICFLHSLARTHTHSAAVRHKAATPSAPAHNTAVHLARGSTLLFIGLNGAAVNNNARLFPYVFVCERERLN